MFDGVMSFAKFHCTRLKPEAHRQSGSHPVISHAAKSVERETNKNQIQSMLICFDLDVRGSMWLCLTMNFIIFLLQQDIAVKIHSLLTVKRIVK